jgi:hypothetical protein
MKQRLEIFGYIFVINMSVCYIFCLDAFEILVQTHTHTHTYKYSCKIKLKVKF